MKKTLRDTGISVATSAIAALIVSLLVVNYWVPIQLNSTQDNKPSTPQYTPQSSQENLVINAVKKANPAVVSIIISRDVPTFEKQFDPFGDFFGFQQLTPNGTEKQEVGGGSGFLVSSDGYIVTNKHVVDIQDAEYTVYTNDGEKYEAKVVARDPLNDVAIVKIDATDLPFLTFGDSDTLEVGQTVIVIGSPLLEFKNSVSVGVVSGLSRSITATGSVMGKPEQLENVIQTDAAINPGNSGGPLLNLNGQVIGVNVAVASAENIGFSLPGNVVSKAYTSVKQTGKIVRPYIGIRYVPITKELQQVNKLAVDYGILISRGITQDELAILPGSPADKAGILENDIILEVDGKKLTEDLQLTSIIAQKQVGDKLKLKVLSKGQEKEVEVVLEELQQ